MHRLPCLLKIGCHEDPSKDVLFCAQNIWTCGLRLWSISLNGEAQFCCLYPQPDGRGKDCRSTNKSTDSAPSSPQQITTLIYLLLKYTTYTFVLMDPKNVTFCVHELKLSCPDQGLTSWLPDWTNKLIAGVELSCTQTPGHRLSLRTSRCFFSGLRTKPSETRGLADKHAEDGFHVSACRDRLPRRSQELHWWLWHHSSYLTSESEAAAGWKAARCVWCHGGAVCVGV